MIDLVIKPKSLAAGVLISLGILFLGASISEAGGLPYVAPPNWSPDGSQVALVVGNDIEVRDASTAQLLHVLRGHTDFIPMVAWSPDGNMIAAPSYDQTVKLWNASDGTLLHTLSGHNALVAVVVWSPDGTQLLSWGFDTRPNLFVWDVVTGALLARHDSGDIVAASFSPNGNMLALSVSLLISVSDGLTLEPIAHSPRVPCCPNTMYSIAWSPDSRTLVTGSLNGLVTLWDASTAQMVMQFEANPYYEPDSRDVDNLALSWVRDVTFAPDGRTVLSVSGDGTVREWEVATGTLVQETRIMPLAGATWSPYSGRLAVEDLTTQSGATLGIEQAFDARNLVGHLNVIVPFATSERLERLAKGCGASDTAANALRQQAQEADHAAFERTVRALALPLACQADLLAVGEAIPQE
jgi:hypothetical protein